MLPRSHTLAIVQARMGSRRLPGKVLAPIGSKPLLLHVLDRLSRARRIDRVLVATSTLPEDDAIADAADAHGFPVFRGSPNDVLDRFYRAVQNAEEDVFVRVTSDCPLVSPHLVDETIAALEEHDADYASNARPKSTYPEGLDVEVFRREALERAWREAIRGSDREHVTPYIWRQPDRFRLCNLLCRDDFERVRLTIDEPIDLEYMRALFDSIDAAGMPWRRVVAWAIVHRDRLPNNLAIPRDAGYLQCVAEEEMV